MACTDHIERARRLAAELRALAAEVHDCDHDACLLLDGVMRDSGCHLRQLADQAALELDQHTRHEQRAGSGNEGRYPPRRSH